MAYNTILNYSASTGAMPLLYSIRDAVPSAFEGLLIAVFIVLFAGNYFLVRSKTGRAKILIALTVSSFFTVILSLFFAMMQVTSFVSTIFWAFVSIISLILLMVSDNA